MESQKLVLIGGGGHCKSCIDVINQNSCYEIVGILDQAVLLGDTVLGHEIIGTDNDILRYVREGCHFLITIGQIKTGSIRKKIFEFLSENKAQLATIVSPKAYVSEYASVGKGTIVMHGCVINAGAKIGDNCILNTGCNIEHDAIVGNHSHVSTLAVVNGDSNIGDEVFIGSNSTISNQIKICDNVVIGAGAVVINNINFPGIYVGNPVKKIH